MPKLSEVFKSDYLKAEDIPEEGMVLTISGVEIKELGQGKDKETKPVLSFKEIEKSLVCNKTNCNTVHKLTGSDDTDDWVGHKVRLLSMEVQFKDELVPAIRISGKPVKAAAPKKPTPVMEDSMEDDVPFNGGELVTS